ncbi:MAG: hypothetical protein ACPGYP_08245 [Solirubrobacterales bacterium]
MNRLTKRELAVLTFIARVGVAQPSHLMQRFQFSRATAYRRVETLSELGLIAATEYNLGSVETFAATRAGIAMAELPLRVANPTWFSLTHDLAMTHVVAELESLTVDCVTEREMIAFRRIEGSDRYLFQVKRTSSRSATTHRADIVCEIPGYNKFIAVEVELSPKNNFRWDSYLQGYANRVGQDGFIGVLYLVGARSEYKRLATRASHSSLGDRFQLLRLGEENMLDGLAEVIRADGARAERRAA